MVLLEALAFERPVVASNVGAIGEVLDETTGFLIERDAGEADAFAMAIQALLSNPDLSARMGRLGRQKVRAEYDRTLCVAAYRELFEPRRLPPSPDRLGVASAQPSTS
jgi:glycosyltransferase involved in cell wall biosynthesis